jgi:L-threonylcarbamoyladenylate synthase
MEKLIKSIQAAEEELLLGNVILYPTDTVWGIGCDALDANAIKRIYKIKEREESKSMILLVADEEMLQKYVAELPADFTEILEQQQRPTTYIFTKAKNLPKELLAEDGSIAIRITKEDFSHKLIRQIGRPIVSTSANVSGEPSPATFSGISDTIKDRVDYVVNWRHNDETKSEPSRIVKIEADGTQHIIRE